MFRKDGFGAVVFECQKQVSDAFPCLLLSSAIGIRIKKLSGALSVT